MFNLIIAILLIFAIFLIIYIRHLPESNKNKIADGQTLRPCRECGHLVSVSADRCPQCGAETPAVSIKTYNAITAFKSPFIFIQVVCGIALVYFVLKIFE